MRWNAIFYSAVAIAAFAIFLIPFRASAMSPGFAGFFSLAGLAATATFPAVAKPTFRAEKENRTNLLSALLTAGLPFADLLLLPLFHQEINAHGSSIFAWFIYAP
jgi:hypothetical protein